MKEATMLYLMPGPHQLNDGHYDYVIVDADEVEAKLDEGWYRTTAEAKAAHEAKLKEQAAPVAPVPAEPISGDGMPPTRPELEAKANELGIQFHHNTGDKKLGEMIEAKLAAEA